MVAIVLVISLFGFVFAAVGGKPPKTTAPSGGAVGGTGLSPAASTPLFRQISSGGDPPADVLKALVVPAGATVKGHERSDAGLELYDGTVTLDVAASRAKTVTFYRTELKAGGWSVSGPDTTADGKHTELFGTRPSTDGYYWEVAVVLTPAGPSLTPALNGDLSAGETTLALTLFEQNDPD